MKIYNKKMQVFVSASFCNVFIAWKSIYHIRRPITRSLQLILISDNFEWIFHILVIVCIKHLENGKRWVVPHIRYNFMLVQMFKFGEFSFADFEIENFLSQKKFWECVLLSSQQFIQCKHGIKTYLKLILFKKFIHFIRSRINIIIQLC